MSRFEHQVVHDDVGVELFEDFTPQRSGVRFPGTDLAARELPVPGKMSADLPPGDEKPIVVLDHGRNHDDIHAGCYCPLPPGY